MAFDTRLRIHEDSVIVSVTQPSVASEADREAFNAAYAQCCTYLRSHPPTEFDIQVSGRLLAPCTEVVINRSLLKKIPLIHDIATNTSSGDGDPCTATKAAETDAKALEVVQEASMQLPCSVWGLVSALLLLEGKVSLKQWFETDWPAKDPSLPAQTLQVRVQSSLNACCCRVGWYQRLMTHSSLECLKTGPSFMTPVRRGGNNSLIGIFCRLQTSWGVHG